MFGIKSFSKYNTPDCVQRYHGKDALSLDIFPPNTQPGTDNTGMEQLGFQAQIDEDSRANSI